MLVIFKLHKIERCNSAIRRIAGNHVNLMRSQRGVRQIERHIAHACEVQIVATRKPRVTILAIYEVVAKSRMPLRRIFRGVGNCFKLEPSRIFTAHQDRKRVVETKRLAHPKVELAFVFALDLIINGPSVADWWMMENRSERCARVFRIKIDLTRNEGVVRQVSAEVEFAI